VFVIALESLDLTGIRLDEQGADRFGSSNVAQVVEMPGHAGKADAEHLPFPDASFDTVVCVLALCSIPDPARALTEMRRVLVPGGTLLLIDHVGSTWPPVYAAQWLLERVTIRAGEYFTRRQLPLVERLGFDVVETGRSRVGTVEWIRAVKPG